MDAFLRRRPAFTLVELLVTLAIIAMLIAILMPALSRARLVARHASALSAMRQVMTGYTIYQHDHREQVPYGYANATVDGSPIGVRLRSGHVIPQPTQLALPAMRYPVRLVPYVSDAWAILYNHDAESLEEPQAGDSDAEAWNKAYLLSTDPAFGINSVYVGGDRGFHGFVGPVSRRNVGKHVVFSASEVRRPSSLIVFTDSKLKGAGMFADAPGYHWATPPVAQGRQWRASGDGFEVPTSGYVGLPEGRYIGAAVTGFFDGHAASLRSAELDDMRLWANGATTADWDYTP